MAGRFRVETLGCPKTEGGSEKLTGTLVDDGLTPADAPDGLVEVTVTGATGPDLDAEPLV